MQALLDTGEFGGTGGSGGGDGLWSRGIVGDWSKWFCGALLMSGHREEERKEEEQKKVR